MTSTDHPDAHAAGQGGDGLPQPTLPGLEDLSVPGYSGTHAARIVGITYRQLDYWARTDLIRPSLSDASGSGSRRRYSYGDLLELRVIKTLLDAGIKLESVREVFTYLRDHLATDIASAHLVISGNSVVLCDGSELIDVLNRGQGVLNVLSLAGVKGDIDARLVPFAEEDLAAEDPGLRRPRRSTRAVDRPQPGPADSRRVV
jgi:DNA-binding transcriptional MerR regulator